MKTRVIAAAVVVLIALAALAVACGGGNGNGEEAGIRTRQGLGVAALAAGADIGAETADQAGRNAPCPALPPSIPASAREAAASRRRTSSPTRPSSRARTGSLSRAIGSAAITADSAILEFYFGGKADRRRAGPAGLLRARLQREQLAGGGTAAEPAPQLAVQAQQITEADLKPVVDAIVAAGVPAADVEVIVTPYYGDPSYGGSATVRATVNNVDSVRRRGEGGDERLHPRQHLVQRHQRLLHRERLRGTGEGGDGGRGQGRP